MIALSNHEISRRECCLGWDYTEFLIAIADPKHEQHEELVEWAGDFESEDFNAIETTKVNAAWLVDLRQYR